MKKSLKYSLILAAVVAGCAGPAYKLNLKPYSLEATDFPFPSGLRILFQEDHSQPTVLVTALVGVGSTSEPQGKEGMAHLIEHLCFKARHGNKPEVWDEIRALGAANFNAFTTQDITQYLTPAPKEALIPLLEIEANRMIDPIEGVTEEELKTEREVVRNELRLRFENGGGGSFLLADELLFPESHPYHRSVIGTHESLNNITLADVRAFLKKWYRPDNITIVVTGDFDRKDAASIIPKVFPKQLLAGPNATAGKMALAHPTPRISGPGDEPPPPVDRAIHHIKGPVPSKQVVLAWSLPGGYRSNQTLMEITASEMTGAVTSTLFPVDPTNPAQDKVDGVGCGAEAQPLATTAFCSIEVTEGQDADKIAKKALDGLVEMWRSENEEGIEFQIGDGEIAKLPSQRKAFAGARSDYEAGLFRESASLGRAIPIAQYLHYTGRADYFTQSIHEASKVTSFDARDLAEKYLTRERAVSIVVEPYDEKDKPVGGVTVDASSSYAGAIMQDDSRALLDFGKITPAQIEAAALAPDLSKIKELTLPNGLKVVLAKHGAAPFVTVGYYTRGGTFTTTPPYLPDFAFSTFDARDPGAVAAGWIGLRGGSNRVVGIEAPSGNLAEAIDMVRSRVTTTKSIWSRRRFELSEEETKRRVRTEEKRPEVWARRALMNLLMPGSPQGMQVDWKAIENLGASDYEKWWKDSLAPKNAELIVVGDVDLDEAERLVRASWSSWRGKDPGTELPGYKLYKDLPARQIVLVDNAEATQSNVIVGCHLAPGADRHGATKETLVEMLDQDLFISIRKRNGASYGVYAQSIDVGDTALMVVGGAIQNDKAIPGLRTILDRMAEIKAGKIDPASLTESKWALAGKTHSTNQSNFDMLATLIDLRETGASLEELKTYPHRLAQVSPQSIAEVLEPCVGHEVIGVTGPANVLRPALSALKIPIEDVDWKKGAEAVPDSSISTQTSKAEPVPAPTAAPKKK